jgi:hypothetical protein
MKANWDTVSAGLDQLFFTPLMEDETPEERADVIEAFISFNGWTWDDILSEMEKESTWLTNANTTPKPVS